MISKFLIGAGIAIVISLLYVGWRGSRITPFEEIIEDLNRDIEYIKEITQ